MTPQYHPLLTADNTSALDYTRLLIPCQILINDIKSVQYSKIILNSNLKRTSRAAADTKSSKATITFTEDASVTLTSTLALEVLGELRLYCLGVGRWAESGLRRAIIDYITAIQILIDN